MRIKLDLKEIERKANYAAFQDGLMEIFMGLFLVFSGVVLVTNVVVTVGAMGVSMAVLGLETGGDFFLTYILPPAIGFMLAIGPYWLGQVYGLTRGYVWAALFVLGGIAMPVFGIASGYDAVGLLCTVVGLIVLVTGTIMFVQFIRNNPVQGVEIEEAPNA